MESIRVIIFRLGKERYGIDVELVKGIERAQQIQVVRIPNSVPYIKGIINLRGMVIPVYNIRSKFNMPDIQSTETTSLLITAVGDVTLAIWVDEVEGIFDIAQEDTFSTPAIVKNLETGYIQNIANMEKGLAIILDTYNLLTDEEKRRVTDMVEDVKGEDD